MKKKNSALLNPVASLASVEHIARVMKKNNKRLERLQDANNTLREEMLQRLLNGEDKFPTLRENFVVLSCDGEYDLEVMEQYKLLEENFGCAEGAYLLVIQRGYVLDEDDEMIFINRVFVAEPRDDKVQYEVQRGLMGLPVQGGILLFTENIFEDVIQEVTLWIEDTSMIFVGPLVNYLCHEERLDEGEGDEDMMIIRPSAPVSVFFHPFPYVDIEMQFGIPCEQISSFIRHYITKRTESLERDRE